jgi:hypothetical protein
MQDENAREPRRTGMPKDPMRLSVKLALHSLADQVYEAAQAKAAYEEAIEVRNAMIRDARSSSVASRTLERITGLSRDRIARIVATPPGPSRDWDS